MDQRAGGKWSLRHLHHAQRLRGVELRLAALHPRRERRGGVRPGGRGHQSARGDRQRRGVQARGGSERRHHASVQLQRRDVEQLRLTEHLERRHHRSGFLGAPSELPEGDPERVQRRGARQLPRIRCVGHVLGHRRGQRRRLVRAGGDEGPPGSSRLGDRHRHRRWRAADAHLEQRSDLVGSAGRDHHHGVGRAA